MSLATRVGYTATEIAEEGEVTAEHAFSAEGGSLRTGSETPDPRRAEGVSREGSGSIGRGAGKAGFGVSRPKDTLAAGLQIGHDTWYNSRTMWAHS